MKLLRCTECRDIIKIGKITKYCECGKSGGRYYEDGLRAEYHGPAIPLGFHTSIFLGALKNQPEEGWGRSFEAFVIPKNCNTFTKVDFPKAEWDSPIQALAKLEREHPFHGKEIEPVIKESK